MLTKTRTKQTLPTPDYWRDRSIGSVTARVLDRLADAELQHGHHEAAEQLSRRAMEMRETAA